MPSGEQARREWQQALTAKAKAQRNRRGKRSTGVLSGGRYLGVVVHPQRRQEEER